MYLINHTLIKDIIIVVVVFVVKKTLKSAWHASEDKGSEEQKG